MEQKDYLKRQIELVGCVIGGILLQLAGRKIPEGMFGIRKVSQILKSELDFDLERLLDLADEDFVTVLSAKDGFDESNLEKFMEILNLLGDTVSGEPSKQRRFYRKSLVLAEYLNARSRTFSLERYDLENRLRLKLQV